MNIDSIKQGIVIDHIRAGYSMTIYNLLGLDQLNCTVAIIKNVKSKKMGRKDIIKIDESMELDLDILGFIDPNITVNVIKDDAIVDKKHLSTPTRIVDVLKCNNPRCITTTEPALHHVFRLTDPERKVYRCLYCDSERK